MDAAGWDKVIREQYPQPLAAGWHRVLVAREPGACLQELHAYHELLMRFTVAMFLADAWRAPFADSLEQRLRDLARPALGHWVGTLHATCEELRARGDAFAPDAVAWALDSSRKDPHGSERFNTLVELRNRVHHGAGFSQGDLRAVVGRAVAETRVVLSSMGWLSRYRVVRVLDETRTRQGALRGSLQVFVGRATLPEPVEATWTAPLSRETVYLADAAGQRFLDLHPFVAVRFVPGANEDRVHVVKEARRLQELTLVHDEARHVVAARLDIGGAPVTFEAYLRRRAEALTSMLEEPAGVAALCASPASGADLAVLPGLWEQATQDVVDAPVAPARPRGVLPGVAAMVAVCAAAVGLASWLRAPTCGDGVVEQGEACDDGNLMPGDLCTPMCTSNLATLPAGAFIMGYREADLDAGMHLVTRSRRPPGYLRRFAAAASPATPVKMQPFRMMRTEVTRGAFRLFLEDTTDGGVAAVERSAESLAWHRALIRRVRDDARPLLEKPWMQPTHAALPVEVEAAWAAAYCAWVGGAPPSEAQFEYAARGAGGDRIYPWGDAPLTGVPTDCARVTGFFILSEAPRLDFNCGGRRPTPVAATAEGCTPEGLCDMTGNTSELVNPGPVRWALEADEGGGPERYVARLPGPIRLPDGTEDYHMSCEHLATDDPFGLRTGMVTDCAEHHELKRATEPNRQHPRERSALVVRGGNFDDSLPVLYQTRARYPLLRHGVAKGFRCVLPPSG